MGGEVGVSALKLREGCRCRSERGDWQASRAHAKQFWEVCPKRGESKPEEPSLRRRGLEEKVDGRPQPAAHETQPTPTSAGTSGSGQKGARGLPGVNLEQRCPSGCC